MTASCPYTKVDRKYGSGFEQVVETWLGFIAADIRANGGLIAEVVKALIRVNGKEMVCSPSRTSKPARPDPRTQTPAWR